MSIITECSRLAEITLEEKGYTALPVDVMKIADGAGIAVAPLPDELYEYGYVGALWWTENKYFIFYSTKIENEGFKRFTIAHELGHFFIGGHCEAILDKSGIHKSREHFSSKDMYEKQADSFAAGLLMPPGLCRQVMRKCTEGLPTIKALSTACNTSLMATAIRYTSITQDRVAVIVSKDGKVLFASASDSMRQAGFFVQVGSALPRDSLSASLANDSTFITQANFAEQESDLYDWTNRKSCFCLEEVQGLGRTGKLLTVLTPQEEDDEEDF